MAGFGKRPAEFVPLDYRDSLDRLSKADLMEIAYSFAIMICGSEEGDGAFLTIQKEHQIICANQYRKPQQLTRREADNG